MRDRAGSRFLAILFGAMIGGYVAIGYEWVSNGLTAPFPSSPMLLFPLVCSIISWSFCEESVPKRATPKRDDLTIFTFEEVTDYLIDSSYKENPAKRNPVQDRYRRLNIMPDKNVGDVFKDLMEGSDPLDT